MNKLFREMEKAINKISSNRQQANCNGIQKFEFKYWEKYPIIKEMCEPLQISLVDTGGTTLSMKVKPHFQQKTNI